MERITALGGTYKDPTAVALGYFDGVHIGHRAVLAPVLKQEGLTPACFTFTFENGKDMLSTPAERETLLDAFGIQVMFCPAAKDIFGLSPEEFVFGVLKKTFNAKFVCCGYDFTFGKNKSGDVNTLKALCKQAGINLQVIDNVCLRDISVHSTVIKQYLKDGDVQAANEMLGYDYCFVGEVIPGARLGRKMHFPTVNVLPDSCKLLPKFGVYASKVVIDSASYIGVTNVGIKPTVAGTIPLTETHILGFEGDLYKKTITVSLQKFMRPEVKFDSVEALRKQIKQDAESVKNLYKIL